MKHLKNLLLIIVLLLAPTALHAQAMVKKGDVVIHLVGFGAFVNHQFYIDIYKGSNSVKVIYSFRDSVKYSEVGKDPEYERFSKIRQDYKDNDPRRKLYWDTIGTIFERHTAYTRDSVTINLKTDTAYSNLLRRLAKASQAELTPKVDARFLDGDSMSVNIITADNNLQTSVSNPEVNTHPLLVGFISNTLNKDKDGNTVKKIRKYYIEY